MKQQLKVIQLIHTAFCVAVFTFGLISFFIAREQIHFEVPKTAETLVFPLISVLGVIFGTILFNKHLGNINSPENKGSKLIQYQTAFLIKCAFFEAGALANIVAFIMDGNAFFMIFAGLSFVFLVMSRPTTSKVADTLSLQDTDIL